MTNLIPANSEIQILQMIAKTAHTSGLYQGVGGESKILMILLAAQDLGIKPTVALNGGIWNIQGKIEISARLMTSMIRKAGHSINLKECNDKICTLKGKRCDNGDEAEVSFTMEDAAKAGLAGRDVWKKYAEDMLYARAMSRLARRLFPDVIGTAYVEGEIDRNDKSFEREPVLAECEVKDCENKESTPQPSTIPESSAKELSYLEELCDPEYIIKVKTSMKQLGFNDYSQITIKFFDRIFMGMKNNAENFQGVKK